MAVVVEDSLHHVWIHQPALYFCYLISEAFDLQIVSIGFLLVMSLE
jgi:hypothetical protein